MIDIKQHFYNNWTSHASAASASGISIWQYGPSLAGLLTSVFSGVCVFCITQLIKKYMNW